MIQMKIYSLRIILAVCFISLITSMSVGCISTFATETMPTLIPTTTPEKLRLIDGELNPCLLINSEEVETVLGVQVTSQAIYSDYMPTCKYLSTSNDQAVLIAVSAVTDESIIKADQPWLKDGDVPISTGEVYERQRIGISKMPEIYEFKDLDNLGDQAFLYKSSYLVINVLKNNIFYQFYGRIEYGVDENILLKLINVALERMP